MGDRSLCPPKYVYIPYISLNFNVFLCYHMGNDTLGMLDAIPSELEFSLVKHLICTYHKHSRFRRCCVVYLFVTIGFVVVVNPFTVLVQLNRSVP
ncbi:hypothetical protein DSECCO2_160830 [anaerobic digester metagenome]